MDVEVEEKVELVEAVNAGWDGVWRRTGCCLRRGSWFSTIESSACTASAMQCRLPVIVSCERSGLTLAHVGSVKVSASMYGSVDQSCGWSETPHWSCSTCEQVMRSAGGASRKGDVESRW